MDNGKFTGKRVLFISAHTPTNLYPQAGQKIALKHLKDYIASGAVVDVVVIANSVEIAVAKDLMDIPQISVYLYPLSKLSKLRNCLSAAKNPLKFATRFSSLVETKLEEMLASTKYDTVHFEYSHSAVYAELVRSYARLNKIKTIISIHDVLFQSFLRQALSNPILAVEAVRLIQYEKQLYLHADELWVLSRKDKNLLTSMLSIPSDKIVIKPPAISDFIKRVKRTPATVEPKSLLFWAAMNRPENEQAILEFVERCFVPLHEKDSAFKLYIVGANPTKKIKALASSSIVVTGYLDDPSSFFEKAGIGIVPLQVGAGLKLKTVEMLAANIPVITTTVGAEGVDSLGQQMLVNDNLEEWVDMILDYDVVEAEAS